MKLYRDAHGVIVGTQAEAKRMGKGWEPIEVPTDKQALSPEPATESWLAMCPPAAGTGTAEDRQKVVAGKIIMDPGPPAATKRMSTDAICLAVSDLSGTDLGQVALEVTARIESLTKLLR